MKKIGMRLLNFEKHWKAIVGPVNVEGFSEEGK